MSRCEDLLYNLDPKKYQRLFEYHNNPLLYDSFWLAYYKNLDGVCFHINGVQTTYIPLEQFTIALARGKRFYSNMDTIVTYRADFLRIEQELVTYLQSPTHESAFFEGLKIHMGMWFSLYTMTDFLHTDHARTEIERNFPDFGGFKEKRRSVINRLFIGENSLFYQFVEEYAKKHDVTKDFVFLHTVDELASGNTHDVSARQNCIMCVVDDTYCILEGGKAIEVASRFVQKYLRKGIVANKGVKTAHAFVFHNDMLHTKQLQAVSARMVEGDILVCETTSPELVLLYKKAGAIITNQGGIMSHAAIISREMGIPCIVGMINATRIIRTGDTVGVDANEGVVRILEKG